MNNESNNLNNNNKAITTSAMVRKLKQENMDFEWYPTTTEILHRIKIDMADMSSQGFIGSDPSILDCGAGDGRSLNYLTEGTKYAIEIAKPLVQAMDEDIYIVGADFYQQTLMDKYCDILFSNPIYSDYEAWTVKIITETLATVAYLVIPERWTNSAAIQQAIELRDVKASVIGSFDFLEADRKARAKIDIVKIDFAMHSGRFNFRSRTQATDPFSVWFDDNFKHEEEAEKQTKTESKHDSLKSTVKNELVPGRDIVSVLVELYDRDMANLLSNYKAVQELDYGILKELGVDYDSLKEGLKTKISGLKNLYWNELFSNMSEITDRLTKKSRETLLSKLTSRTDVDFNPNNIYMIVIWAIKNANYYYSYQLVDLVEKMVKKANVVSYKSNQRTFEKEEWRYSKQPEGMERFGLDYRIVLSDVGGVSYDSWSQSRYYGLKENAFYFLLDILTVAGNIGFDTNNKTRPSDFSWHEPGAKDFYYYDYNEQKEGLLMSVRAFKNGNLHIKFNARFMKRLNVEFGRLKGWLKSAPEAASELDIPLEEVAKDFNANLKIASNDLLMLSFDSAA